MKTLNVDGLEVRWEVTPSQQEVKVDIVYISGMQIDSIRYACDPFTSEVMSMSPVKDRAFIKACHAVLRRCGLMEKKTMVTGKGLFKKEVNRRFFTEKFFREGTS